MEVSSGDEIIASFTILIFGAKLALVLALYFMATKLVLAGVAGRLHFKVVVPLELLVTIGAGILAYIPLYINSTGIVSVITTSL